MRSIKHKILVLSGKGGVGKSTFSAQLAFALASHGRQVCAHLHMHHQPQTALLAIAFVQCLRAHQPVQVSAKGTAAAVNVITAAFSTALELIMVVLTLPPSSLPLPLSLTIPLGRAHLAAALHCASLHAPYCLAVFFSPAFPRLWQAGLFRGSYSNPAFKRCCLLLLTQRWHKNQCRHATMGITIACDLPGFTEAGCGIKPA